MIAYSIYRHIKKTKAKEQQRQKQELHSGKQDSVRKQRRSSFPTDGFLLFEDMDDDTKYPNQPKSLTHSREQSMERAYTLVDML